MVPINPSEQFPPQIKLLLLQNAIRPIDDLRIVETFILGLRLETSLSLL